MKIKEINSNGDVIEVKNGVNIYYTLVNSKGKSSLVKEIENSIFGVKTNITLNIEEYKKISPNNVNKKYFIRDKTREDLKDSSLYLKYTSYPSNKIKLEAMKEIGIDPEIIQDLIYRNDAIKTLKKLDYIDVEEEIIKSEKSKTKYLVSSLKKNKPNKKFIEDISKALGLDSELEWKAYQKYRDDFYKENKKLIKDSEKKIIEEELVRIDSKIEELKEEKNKQFKIELNKTLLDIQEKVNNIFFELFECDNLFEFKISNSNMLETVFNVDEYEKIKGNSYNKLKKVVYIIGEYIILRHIIGIDTLILDSPFAELADDIILKIVDILKKECKEGNFDVIITTIKKDILFNDPELNLIDISKVLENNDLSKK